VHHLTDTVDVPLHQNVAEPGRRAMTRVAIVSSALLGRLAGASSCVEFDGRDTPPRSVFRYGNRPAGLDENHRDADRHERATPALSQLVKVVPRAGL
jgi:hypothetical protein